ncbi:hypothetical protein DFH09DRAFT_1365732 [Mycena vulgaris]|nr:hypothetical protein DFH09DRAFT_1365732 [Mycena vulgaris]
MHISVALDSESTITVPVFHHKLQIFRLICHNEEESSQADILDLIRLPALRSLHLGDIKALDVDDHIFLQFLSHSSTSLRQFSFCGNEAAQLGTHSESWFFAMSKLTDVEFINPQRHFMDSFIFLLNRYAVKTFLTRLQNLRLSGYSFPIDAKLVQALSSICTAAHGVVNLRSFRLIWTDTDSWKLDDAVTAPLERHMARGINIYMGPADRNELLDAIARARIRKRNALDDFIAAHLAMVFPARKLPEDIIRDIFRACLPSYQSPLSLSYESPLLLCFIFSGWRQLALSTPRLWAAVHVAVPNQAKLQVLIEISTAWLNRSGVLPLSICVACSRVWEGTAVAPTLALLTRFSRD